MNRLALPLNRLLRAGNSGADVVAVKRALARAGSRSPAANTSPRFGLELQMQLVRFQRSRHLEPDGVYGPATHRALASFFDGYGAWLLQKAAGLTAGETAMRELIVANALLGYAHRDAIHYTMGPRRMEGVTLHLLPPLYPSQADCSSFATWCYFAAGAPDPNGRNYDGTGYTGTLAEHGRKIAAGASRPGDLILYGPPWPYKHVAIRVGRWPRVVSHGSEGGPYLLDARYRDDLADVRSYLP